MAKIKINFNNKDYSVDESSLSSASASLQSHLSTTMSGSGATVALGGQSYNVDSEKLLAATNRFISHLGLIAGNGYKVVVNGVEYSVGSDKVAGAVSELEIVLGGLSAGDSEGFKPEKNAYGFYFNTPYVIEYDSGWKEAKMFYEDGCVINYFSMSGEWGIPEDDMQLLTCEVNNEQIPDHNYDSIYLTCNEDGTSIMLYDNTYVAEFSEEHGVYFGETYVSKDGETFIPYENNRVVFSGTLGERYLEGWFAHDHFAQSYEDAVLVSVDGTMVYAGRKNDGLKAYYLVR